MSDIVKKMRDHMPKGFFWLQVLLAANMTIPALDDGAAVQAILFFPLRGMRQSKIFLKISTNKYTGSLSFPLLNNSGNFE